MSACMCFVYLHHVLHSLLQKEIENTDFILIHVFQNTLGKHPQPFHSFCKKKKKKKKNYATITIIKRIKSQKILEIFIKK